MDVKAAMETS